MVACRMIEESHQKILATADILNTVADRTNNQLTAQRLRNRANAMRERLKSKGVNISA